jgi:hypothetical protein
MAVSDLCIEKTNKIQAIRVSDFDANATSLIGHVQHKIPSGNTVEKTGQKCHFITVREYCSCVPPESAVIFPYGNTAVEL